MRRARGMTVSGPPGRPGTGSLGLAQRACARGAASDPARWATTLSHLAAIVEHSNDAIFSRRLDGTITTWNAAATRMFGFRAREIIGHSSRALLPRGHRDELRRLVARIRRGEVVEHFETLRLRKDGRALHVSLTLSPIRDACGRLAGFSTIARDTTEQGQVRAALERRARELAELFEEASIGLLFTTREGRILRANPALLRVLECRVEHCVGQRLARFHPDRKALAALLRGLVGRETLRNSQTALRSRNGRIKEVLVDASAFWESGKVVHIRWFIRDITRRKQLEREVLAISERERRALARDLHDSLGQQLSGIAYLGNVLRERLKELGLPEAAEAERISRLLKGAIEETRRVSRGLSPVRPDAEGLVAALGELAAQTRDVFGIACSLRCPRPVLVWDSEAATHLHRIAQEALSNAIRHGQARRVTIALKQSQGNLSLSIQDNGKGIGALSPRRKGLGLRVMHYRAGLMRGTLSVRRRAVGTEVRCVVPAPKLPARRTR